MDSTNRKETSPEKAYACFNGSEHYETSYLESSEGVKDEEVDDMVPNICNETNDKILCFNSNASDTEVPTNISESIYNFHISGLRIPTEVKSSLEGINKETENIMNPITCSEPDSNMLYSDSKEPVIKESINSAESKYPFIASKFNVPNVEKQNEFAIDFNVNSDNGQVKQNPENNFDMSVVKICNVVTTAYLKSLEGEIGAKNITDSDDEVIQKITKYSWNTPSEMEVAYTETSDITHPQEVSAAAYEVNIAEQISHENVGEIMHENLFNSLFDETIKAKTFEINHSAAHVSTDIKVNQEANFDFSMHPHEESAESLSESPNVSNDERSFTLCNNINQFAPEEEFSALEIDDNLGGPVTQNNAAIVHPENQEGSSTKLKELKLEEITGVPPSLRMINKSDNRVEDLANEDIRDIGSLLSCSEDSRQLRSPVINAGPISIHHAEEETNSIKHEDSKMDSVINTTIESAEGNLNSTDIQQDASQPKLFCRFSSLSKTSNVQEKGSYSTIDSKLQTQRLKMINNSRTRNIRKIRQKKNPPSKTNETSKNASTRNRKSNPRNARQRRKPSHPPTSIMVIESLKALKIRKGASVQAICKYLKNNFDVNMKIIRFHMNKFLRNGVQSGLLQQLSGRGAMGKFKLKNQESKNSRKDSMNLRQ